MSAVSQSSSTASWLITQLGASTKQDAAGDYSVVELMVVLDRFGLELDIFEQIALKKMKEGPAGPAPDLTIKTKVQIAVDRIREQPTSSK
ncbi:hypothetical protein [Herbaspirillum aquaticum]|uniref:hypothetical protein n=1 Tax=Herbaspirillum aquaticum TaxID=568783 RepID=UPI00138FD12D|nr:hypothetical protein [Herbaspirillum aquaticum]